MANLRGVFVVLFPLFGMSAVAQADSVGRNETHGVTNAVQTNLRQALKPGSPGAEQAAKPPPFSAQLRAWRDTNHLSEADAGKLLDVDPEVITAFEADTFQPSVPFLKNFETVRQNTVAREGQGK